MGAKARKGQIEAENEGEEAVKTRSKRKNTRRKLVKRKLNRFDYLIEKGGGTYILNACQTRNNR